MKTLVIAEKQKYAKEAIMPYFEQKLQRKAQYTKNNHYIIGDYIIAYCSGHLRELLKPDEMNPRWGGSWDYATLPIIPDEYITKPTESEREYKIYTDLMELISKAGYIIHCGDPDREGQIIVDVMLQAAGYTKKVDRVLVNAIDYNEIDEAFSKLLPNSEFRGLSEAGIARRDADWLMGMNYSRMASIATKLVNNKQTSSKPQPQPKKFSKDSKGKAGYEKGKDNTQSCGRVITPALRIIVQRYKDILNFRPKDFYTISGDLVSNNINFSTRLVMNDQLQQYLDSEGRIVDKSFVESFVSTANLGFKGIIQNVKIKEVKRSHPLLYNTSKLQAEANKIYKISPNITSDCLQELYLAGIITYPRTNNQYAYESDFDNYPNVINLLKEDESLVDYIVPADQVFKSKSWNDKNAKAKGHSAIILLNPSLDKLAMIQSKNKDTLIKIYQLIAIRYLAQFYPNKVDEETTIEVEYFSSNPYIFRHKSKINKILGFDKILNLLKSSNNNFGVNTDEVTEDEEIEELQEGNQSLKNLKEGDSVSLGQNRIFYNVSKTTPPPKMTFGRLITILASIHLYIKDFNIKLDGEEAKAICDVFKLVEGIGTDSSRNETIVKLKEKEYVVEKKDGTVEPTQKGIDLIELLESIGVEQIYSPIITARNELSLTQIQNGEITRAEFLRRLEDIITDDLIKFKSLAA